jgi:serine/threonine-protein kinase
VAIEPSRAGAWSFLSHLYYYKRDDKVGAKLAAQRAYEEDAYYSAADGILWRLFATSYDLGQFADAVHWCAEGERRFPESHRFVECELWDMTTPSVRPDVSRAWRLLDRLRALAPKRDSVYEDHLGRMLVAATLARAGAADSARRLMLAARADPAQDPPRELVKFEAFARTLLDTPRDRDEALRLLKLYLSAHRAHEAGDETNEHWWWRSLRDDPRYLEIAGGRAEGGG